MVITIEGLGFRVWGLIGLDGPKKRDSQNAD